jgi:hypothetical protein
MSIDISTFTPSSRYIIRSHFCQRHNTGEIVNIYECVCDGKNCCLYQCVHLLVITKLNNIYHYSIYYSDDYLDSNPDDDYNETIYSHVLVKISKNISRHTLQYFSIIPRIAKELEPHFIGELEVKPIIMKTGTLGHPDILELVRSLEYEFEGKNYNYRDVKDLIQYREK